MRAARDDDHPAALQLTLDAYAEYEVVMEPTAWKALSRAVRAAFLANGSPEHLVAEHRDRLVGSVLLFPPGTRAYGAAAGEMPFATLRLLAVHPDARGLGAGRRLVDACIARAREMGAGALGLHTSRSMHSARRLYECMGFVRAPEHDFHPPGAEIVEGYRLPL